MSDHTIVFPASGHKERRLLAFDTPLLSGDAWPYIAISGTMDGPTVCLLAGIHGAEYPPIDALMRFCRSLDAGALRGRIVAVPVVNLPAFWERTPFVCPRDGKNPNRAFPGDAHGSYTEVLAHAVFETVIRRGDYLIDLHAGDMVEELAPFSLVQQTSDATLDATALDLATAFGLPYLVVQAPSGGPVAGTTTAAAAAAGIPAIIAEAGGVGQLQAEAVAMHLRGLDRALHRLGMLDGAPAALPQPIVMHDFVWLRTEQGGFFRKEIGAGDTVAAGASIGQMVDLWGEPLTELHSPVDGVVLFVTTSPAMPEGGLVVGIGVP